MRWGSGHRPGGWSPSLQARPTQKSGLRVPGGDAAVTKQRPWPLRFLRVLCWENMVTVYGHAISQTHSMELHIQATSPAHCSGWPKPTFLKEVPSRRCILQHNPALIHILKWMFHRIIHALSTYNIILSYPTLLFLFLLFYPTHPLLPVLSCRRLALDVFLMA